MMATAKQNAGPRPRRRRWRDLLLLAFCRPDRLIAISWWRLCGKRLRARYRYEEAVAALPFAHERWLADRAQDDMGFIAAHSLERSRPAICVHLHVPPGASRKDFRRAERSIRLQSLAPSHVLLTRGSGSETRACGLGEATEVDGDFATQMEGLRAALMAARECGADLLIPLLADAALPAHAIATFTAHELRRGREPGSSALLYGDQHEVAPFWRGAKPWLKPEWDARMIWSQDYVSRSCAFPVDAALDFLDRDGSPLPESLYAFILRLVQRGPALEVDHVPRSTMETPVEDWRRQETEHLRAAQQEADGAALVAAGPFATVQLQWPMPNPAPRVSIVVATRDKVDLLRTCVTGVLEGTDYPDLELIVADNDSQEPETLGYMRSVSADPRVRVVRWPHPFNYSAINNYAASFATGELLCLLNNDIEVLDPNWLDEMVREAARPGVGAVGARLLYPDRSIQHAGVAIGLGNAAGHAHRGLPEGAPGYYAQALIARGASAVTGACLLVAKRHFDAVGGLDEEQLAVAYNDVDLCLKLRQRGLTNIYTPAATLIHHESKSRGPDFAPEHLDRYLRELEVFQERWGTTRVVDPWHHPQLDRGSETYSPSA